MCLQEYNETSQMALEASGLRSKTGLSTEEVNEAVRLLKDEGLIWVYDAEIEKPFSFNRAKITTKGEYAFLNSKLKPIAPPKKETSKAITKWFLTELDTKTLTEEKAKAEAIFDNIITNKSIRAVSRTLFMDGHYRNAVLDAMVQLEVSVKKQARHPKDDSGRELSGCSLMRKVFDVNHPILKWAKLEDQYQKDEYAGYAHIMAGAMQGIRDPKAHMIFEQKPLRALQLLTLASLLVDLVEISKYVRHRP
jgi:uncharacterized protein (TIGR02391 family)